MVGRSVSWVAKHPDQAIPNSVKARICLSQNGRCAAHPWERLRPGHFEFDHKLALCLGGAHAEANLRAICTDAHKVKSADDTKLRAKADRVRIKHLGLAKPKGRSFGNRSKKFNGEVSPTARARREQEIEG